MEIKPIYKCPICGKEYSSDKNAIVCSNRPKRRHKYKIGSIVQIKTNQYCATYTALIKNADGYDGHEPKYIVDPKNGICTYDVLESQIVKEIMSLELLNKREMSLDALIDECRHSVTRLFGEDCKIDDYSHLTWDEKDKKVATVKFYIKK